MVSWTVVDAFLAKMELFEMSEYMGHVLVASLVKVASPDRCPETESSIHAFNNIWRLFMKLTWFFHRAGVISMILCFALGIANIIAIWRPVIVIFAALCLYVSPIARRSLEMARVLTIHPNRASSLVILFIEVPLLLRICPTSDKFDGFIRKFSTNYTRAAIYLVMSTVQWLSLVTRDATSLIAAAVVLLITASFYAIAGLRKDQFMSSKTLGGQGVAQMIV
jgi:hypothetical protein